MHCPTTIQTIVDHHFGELDIDNQSAACKIARDTYTQHPQNEFKAYLRLCALAERFGTIMD